MTSVCLEYLGQREIAGLGKNVGRSSIRRDEARLSQVQTRWQQQQWDEAQRGGRECSPCN